MRSVQTGQFARPYLAYEERPLFFAHRGGSLLAPENTLPAFERGAALGADALELDIQMTRDGRLVVSHDETIDRTTDGTGPVSSYTYDELRRFDAGYRFTPDGGATFPFRGQGITIPLFSDVLERFPTLRINVDLKESTAEREAAFWRLLQDFAAEDRVLAGCFEHAPLARFRRLCEGRVATSASRPEVRNFVLAALSHTTRLALRPMYDALQVPETAGALRIVSLTTVTAAHRMGLAVHVWTVDEREGMERLLDLGVDGLMSDRPDVLADVLDDRAQRGTMR